jgi:hypothetical protein
MSQPAVRYLPKGLADMGRSLLRGPSKQPHTNRWLKQGAMAPSTNTTRSAWSCCPWQVGMPWHVPHGWHAAEEQGERACSWPCAHTPVQAG